jgi:SNF2 family DNA or RNA helicase
MSLPPISKRVTRVTFSAEEEKEFEKLEQAAQQFYLGFRAKYKSDMSKHFLKVSAKLIPLRVASSGGKYPLETQSDKPNDEVEENLDEDEMEIDNKEEDDNGMDVGNGKVGVKKNTKGTQKPVLSKFEFTSKFNVLLTELKRIRDEEPDSKSLVFSQFSTTLEWLQEELPKHGFQFRTLSGSMSMTQRAKALQDFQNDPPTTIFCLR